VKRSDVVEQVSKLVAAFGKDGIGEETIEVYVNGLTDVEGHLLAKAVHRIILTRKFFPRLAEVREAVLAESGEGPTYSAETQALIRRADVRTPVYRRDGSFAYEERTWEWPDGINQATRLAIEETLARVGEPCDGNGKPIFGWEAGFKEVYEGVSDDIRVGLLSDLSRARLPAPKPPKALPA